MRRIVIVLFVVAFAALAPAAAQDVSFDAVQISTEKVAEGIYMLSGRGGNMALCTGEDGAFLVDDQFAPLAPKIQEAIARATRKPLRFVVNTHWHPDHTGGNEAVGGAGAVIVAHENVRKRLGAEQFVEALDMRTPPAPKAALPIITFTDSVSFHLNGERIDVRHMSPAHTDGDSIIHFRKADVLHLGDIFFNEAYPFIDLSSGGRVDGVIEAAREALDLAGDRTKIIPGHGALANRAALASYITVLTTVRDRVRELVKQGKSLDEVVAAQPTKDLDEKWGKGFMTPEKFVRIVATDVARRSW